MPAYAKVSLVTPVFHPSDIAFAIGWSNTAPGYGNWRVVVDNSTAAELISVIPPGCDDPVFFISRHGGEVVMERQPPGGGARSETGRFRSMRDALLLLCPLDDDTLEEIQMGLERDFPRHPNR